MAALPFSLDRPHRLFLVLVAIMALSSTERASVAAVTPPAASLLSQGVHPRLLVTQTNRQAIRQRLVSHYRSQFQDFLNALNQAPAPTGQATNDAWGAVNFAFVAAMGPVELRQQGFSLGSSLGTEQQLCDRAMSYVNRLVPQIANGTEQGHEILSSAYPGPTHIPVILVYDWCYANMAPQSRTAIVDAFVSTFGRKYRGRNLTNMNIAGSILLANNSSSAQIHDLLAVLAFYGDSYPSTSIQTELYDAFAAIWLDRTLGELNYFYPTAANWHEGPGNYFRDGFLNLAIPYAMMTDALGVDYIASTPFFATNQLFHLANLEPYTLASQCGSDGRSRCPDYLNRFGSIVEGSNIGCKVEMLNAGLLRRSGHPGAALSKWLYTDGAHSCSSTVTSYGGVWAHAVFYWFLFGDAEVTAQSPSNLAVPTSQRLGLGQYVFKSGFGPTDSQVTFWAQPYQMYGHAMQSFGHFTVHKYGGLVLRPGNGKAGDARIDADHMNLMQNLVGIHKGGSDPELGFDGAIVDPYFAERGISWIRQAGSLLAESMPLGGSGYDYVAYDNTVSWKPETASASQRELAFLRGPENSEFVVVFDRLASNPSFRKVWKIWVPTEPGALDGTMASPRAGKLTSTNTSTVQVTNQLTNVKTPVIESAPTHGRLFLRVLQPEAHVVNFLGGAGHEFQSGNDDGTTPWGAPPMTDAMRSYLGWGRIEVVPQESRPYDTFLNVLQIGESRTMTSVASITKVQSTDARMTGAHVGDPRNQWVVLFATGVGDVKGISEVTYAFDGRGLPSKHLVVNLRPSASFYITAASGALTTIVVSTTPMASSTRADSSSDGVLAFGLNGAVVSIPPSKPAGLQVIR